MKNALKAVLLGGAASLVSLAGANAADLPVAEPVEYVKVCETYGAGFFYIPGTDTCLRVGGYVRFQIHSQTDNAKEDAWESDPFTLSSEETGNDTYSMLTRGLVNFDARTETEYGTLRSFIQIRGTALDQDGVSTQLDKAFLQFAGITAGLTTSLFVHGHPTDYFGTHVADFGADTIQLNYTAELGGGFSVSAGVESAERADNASPDNFFGLGAVPGSGIDTELDNRTESPAAVAALRVKQGWGSASLVGAVAESKTNLVGLNGDGDVVYTADEESDLGWAVGAGITVNLPALAEGDSVTVKAAYSDGLSWYTMNGASFIAGNHTWTDVEGPGLNLETETVQVFTAYAGLVHNWTSTVRSNFALNYIDLDFGHGAEAQGGSVSGNLIWSPVKNLDIGLELFYSQVEVNDNGNAVLGFGDENDADGFGAIFRIQRNFGS